MKAKENGKAEQCAINLLLLTRGEVPYERLKGRNAELIDAPIGTAANDAEMDVEWLMETYEPRVRIDKVDILTTLANVGDLGINANISIRKEGADLE